MRKHIHKVAWFLAFVAGFILETQPGDFWDKLMMMAGGILGLWLFSFILAWLGSLFDHKEKRDKRRKEYFPWLMIFLSIMSITSTIKSIREFSVFKTDKSPEFSEQVGNLYRNTKYGFRINFPEGWEVKPGDGPSILQKAIGDDQSLIVGVRDLSGTVDEAWTINNLMTLEEFEREQIEATLIKYPNAKIISSGKSKIDNIPTYWVKLFTPYLIHDTTVEAINLHYQILYRSVLFFINAGATVDKFDSTKSEFKKSISTFVFENY